MQRVMTAAIALVALLSGMAEAQQPGYGPPYFSPYPPPPPYGGYRPQDPSNARGVPPAQLPPAPPARSATPPPTAETTANQPAPASAPVSAPSNPPASMVPPGAMAWPGYPMAPPGFPAPAKLSGPPPQAPPPQAAAPAPSPTHAPAQVEASAQPSAKAPTQVPPAAQAPAHAPAQFPASASSAPTSVPAAAPPTGYPYGAFPGWSPPYAAPSASPWGQPSAQAAPRAPRLEVELGERQAYVQENVLLRLKVISDQSLTKATPEFPDADDLILQKLEEPKASSRTAPDGHREIVTEFIYALTPLRAGDLSLPAPRVTGEMAGDAYGRAQRFDASGSEAIRLQVRPALTSVQPWLPLRALTLKASLDDHPIKAGEPVSLMLELDAIGATGSQLPSLESFLESSDFRVYREQTLTEARVSADGQRLEGKRTEHYTLVPRADGRLYLPELRLTWWNVATGSREWVGLPARLEGGAGEEARAVARGEESDSGAGWLWLSLSSLLLPMIGFAAGLRYRGRMGSSRQREPLGAGWRRRVRAVAGLTRRRLGRARDRLHPAPLWRRLGRHWRGLLPASSRFLFCLSAANREREPAVWARRFQSEACRHLPTAVQTPGAGVLPGLAGQVLRLRPGADPDQVIRLLRQLDGALYGGQDIDFGRWKRDFARQVGRIQGLLRTRGGKPRLERPRLPALNPSPV
ncbi:MAG: BatD family protein [Chromatiaceae bacterium]|nr:BatD family protein [Chromatiaceae bacterium]